VKNLLLTGKPGVGKTTAVLRALELAGVPARGFVTGELRGPRGRTGFQLRTLDGRTDTLASVDFPGPPRVGKYGVRLEALERLGVPEIDTALAEGTLLVVDEIGKMELFSRSFRDAILRALDAPVAVLATITRASHPVAQRIKKRPDVQLVEITPSNRESVVQEVLVPWIRDAVAD